MKQKYEVEKAVNQSIGVLPVRQIEVETHHSITHHHRHRTFTTSIISYGEYIAWVSKCILTDRVQCQNEHTLNKCAAYARRRLVLKINVCDSSGWDSHGWLWIFVSHFRFARFVVCIERAEERAGARTRSLAKYTHHISYMIWRTHRERESNNKKNSTSRSQIWANEWVSERAVWCG